MKFEGTAKEFKEFIEGLEKYDVDLFETNKCKNCKYWGRQKNKLRYVVCDIGRCYDLENYNFPYWEGTTKAMKVMLKGKILCTNLYTHEDFGCIRFKKKHEQN